MNATRNATPFTDCAFAVALATATRPGGVEDEELSAFMKKYVSWGAGPRASYYLILAAKARAILQGRYSVSEEDVRAMILPVLRHRIVATFRAEADGIATDDIVERVAEAVKFGG